jgi:glyoxylase-like metal-dependent hydrolase (beta-lactamase superfamily II)
LGGLIVVFDTFLTPQAANDLKQFSLDMLGGVPDVVVNSHYHNDHLWGNQAFEGATIISSARTRGLMDTEGKAELDWYQAHSVEQLEVYRKRFQDATDEEKRQSLLGMVGYYEGLVEAMPCLTVCKPGLFFENSMSLHGENRSTALIDFEGAHTASDTVLFLPADGILFMGDLLFVKSHPYLSEGDPQKLLAALDTLLRLEAECFVPGHGPVGKREDVHAMIDYVKFCIDAVDTCIKSNAGLDALLETPIPERFQGWQMPQMYPGNLKSIYEKVKRN